MLRRAFSAESSADVWSGFRTLNFTISGAQVEAGQLQFAEQAGKLNQCSHILLSLVAG